MNFQKTQRGAWRHFRARLGERYGIHNMEHHEWLALRDQIKNGHKSNYVGRKSNTKTWWIVRWKNAKILALYCSKVNGFLSCLPTSKLEKALAGNQSIRNYLGLTQDSVMLRKFNEETAKRAKLGTGRSDAPECQSTRSPAGDPPCEEELVQIVFEAGA
jgi:hypothetical protein